MKHQPFEEWLLNEMPLTPEQKRELDLHIRSCVYCSALMETGVVLHSVKMVAPADGFTARFQVRLAERKLAEHRRRVWGTILFLIGGLSFLLWLAGPSIFAFLSSPATWVASLVEWGIFLITTFSAMMQAGEVLLHVIPAFVPPFAWMIIISAFAGISLLWTVSIWRFTRVPQGV
jgi:magnesium-transporting ATPase (P-type)